MTKLLTEMRPEEWNADVIMRATAFTASIYSGQGQYSTSEFTRAEKGDAALAFAAASAMHMNRTSKNCRKAIVYAVTPEGRQAMVPTEFWQQVLADELASAKPARK
jgi:hypothetical protein